MKKKHLLWGGIIVAAVLAFYLYRKNKMQESTEIVPTSKPVGVGKQSVTAKVMD